MGTANSFNLHRDKGPAARLGVVIEKVPGKKIGTGEVSPSCSKASSEFKAAAASGTGATRSRSHITL
jgi:hypothetical protein